MATELAKAYVQIIPSAKGIKGMLHKELGGEVSAAGESAGKSFGGGLLSGLAGIGKAAAAALGAATAAVGALSKLSLDAYGNYEQLVGGVETLFKDSSDIVMGYANNAYKTAGMSANQYMELATSFSASLLQGLQGDTEAAARYTDIAISDMSDNINKFGSDAQSVQNAYQGFAKGNFTMLDNLKLGYGGTQSEMQRLLDTANKLNAQQGIYTNYQIKNYADIVAAIHVVQTEMDISGISAEEAAAAVASGAMTQAEAFEAMGTTAKEASTTIQGSLSAAGAALQNLITGIADENASLDTLIGNFVESVETAAGNIVPRFTQILSGMGQAIQKLAPVIAQQLPSLITSALPAMINAGAQLLVGLTTGIVSALPALLAEIPNVTKTLGAALSDNATALSNAGKQLLSMLVKGVTVGIPEMLRTAGNIVTALVDGFSGALPDLQAAAEEMFNFLITSLQENLPTMLEQGLQALLSFSGGLREGAGQLVDAAITLIQTLADGLIEALPAMIETIPLIVSNIANIINDNAPKLLETAAELIWKLVTGLIDNIPVIIANMPQIIAAVWDTISAVNWVNLGSNLIQGLANGISAMGQFLKETMKNILQHPIDATTGALDTFKALGGNVINFFSSGMRGMISSVISSLGNIQNMIRDVIGKLISSAGSWGSDFVQGFANGIVGAINSVINVVAGLADKVRSYLHFSRPDVGPLRDYETWMPDFMQGLAQGIDANVWRVQNAVKGLAQDMTLDLSPSVQMPSLHAAAVAADGAPLGGGTVTNLYQTIYTHDSLSESELTREAEDLLERGRWKNP